MDDQLVTFSSSRTPVRDYDLQPVSAGSSPLACITEVGNTPALLPQSSFAPVAGPSWMTEVAPTPATPALPPLTTTATLEQPLTLQTSLPAPAQYNPLQAMASMTETFALEESTMGTRRFSWQNSATTARSDTRRSYAGSAERIASLAETMIAASQTDTLLQEKDMLGASHQLRRQLSGTLKPIRQLVPQHYRVPLANVASVYEVLHGWGLFRINRAAVISCAVESEARQNSLLRLRQLISEQVISRIHRGQLSITSPASLQQQQFAAIVQEVYQAEKNQALQRLNTATPPGTESGGWRRFSERSTRALVDEADPTETVPQFTLNVQCGEQAALTFALLLQQQPRPVSADHLRMITFNGAEDNHSVVLYACSPDCDFSELGDLSNDPRAPVSPDHFLTWLFYHRRDVLLLDPGAEDDRLGRPAEAVKFNALSTNKCIAFYGCASRQQVVEGVTSLLRQAGIGLTQLNVTIDHPLAEASESALENARSETASDHSSDDWDSSLYDTEMDA